jgi:hypothetical protein
MIRDYVVTAEYAISLSCALYILIAYRKYFLERYRAGIASLLVIAIFIFLTSYSIKMAVAFVMKVIELSGGPIGIRAAMSTYAWTFAMTGTTLSFLIMTYLTRKKTFDIFIYRRRLKNVPDGHDPMDIMDALKEEDKHE